MSGINVVSGLASGVDWREILDQLRAVELKRVEVLQNRKKTYADKLSAWQSINTKLLSLKTAATTLYRTTAFNLWAASLSSNTTTAAEDVLSITTDTSAAKGTYKIVVNSLASAQKISSKSFTSATTALGLSGDMLVNGKTVTVSATDTLSSLRDKINAVNTGTDPSKVTASVVHYGTEDHRLIFTSDEEGVAGMTLENGGGDDILEALGINDTLRGVTGNIANTVDGAPITPSSLIKDIDTYRAYWASGARITLRGTDTAGNTVDTNAFRIYAGTTVQNLLNAIEAAFGDVTAQVTADGRIQVIDNEEGDTQLRVMVEPADPTLNFDTDNDFGDLYTIQTSEIQAGANASFTVDGVAVTRSSNTVDDLITGVTLNLLKAASDTTITLTIDRDTTAVKEKIAEFVKAFNETMEAINAHLNFDAIAKKEGGVLFGDSTLRTIKSNLTRLIVDRIPGVDENFSTLGLIGISLDRNGKLTIQEDDLKNYLETSFAAIQKLFAADWSSSNSALSYINHGRDTKAGTYNVTITGTNPVTGFFVTEGDAEGNGEFLRGVSGDAKDLVVRYSGTATGLVGSFTLTYGVAELLDRSLFYLTDSVSGTIRNKNKAIQSTIDGLEENIAGMKDRVDSKMERLERQFIAMESALSAMQSISNWLTGQINAVNKSWK